MQFLALIEAIASSLNATNIENFITLTENLITVGESVFKHQAVPVAAAVVPVIPSAAPSAATAS